MAAPLDSFLLRSIDLLMGAPVLLKTVLLTTFGALQGPPARASLTTGLGKAPRSAHTSTQSDKENTPQSPCVRSSSPAASARKGQGTTSPTTLKDLRHQVGILLSVSSGLISKVMLRKPSIAESGDDRRTLQSITCTSICAFVGDCADAHGPHVAKGLLAGFSTDRSRKGLEESILGPTYVLGAIHAGHAFHERLQGTWRRCPI